MKNNMTNITLDPGGRNHYVLKKNTEY